MTASSNIVSVPMYDDICSSCCFIKLCRSTLVQVSQGVVMNSKIYAVFGILVIVACLLPALAVSGQVVARGKPGGGTTTGGVGTAGPASKSGADGIVKKYALCVGVSNYIDSRIGDLSYCDEDAADWKSYLQGKGYSVSSLVDSQAKETSVESALFSIIAAADADDQIVFATSGHGTSSVVNNFCFTQIVMALAMTVTVSSLVLCLTWN